MALSECPGCSGRMIGGVCRMCGHIDPNSANALPDGPAAQNNASLAQSDEVESLHTSHFQQTALTGIAMDRQRYRRFATNCGILLVVSYVVYNGLTWAAQWRQCSVDCQDKALRMARESRSLVDWFSNGYGYHFSAYDNNESFVRGSISQRIFGREIIGWKCRKVSDETYLVSCTYREEGRERGYYFEVNLNMGTVVDIFSDTALEKQYKDYGIHPDWKMVLTPDPEHSGVSAIDLRVAN